MGVEATGRPVDCRPFSSPCGTTDEENRMPSQYRFLTDTQVEQFLTRGYIVLHDCFSRDFAQSLTAHAFERLGYDPDDPSTWKQPRIHMPNVQFFPMETYAPKAWAAACDLLGGEERI